MYNILFVDVTSLLNNNNINEIPYTYKGKQITTSWNYQYITKNELLKTNFVSSKINTILDTLINNKLTNMLCANEMDVIYKFIHDNIHQAHAQDVKILNISDHHYCNDALITDKDVYYAYNWITQIMHHFNNNSVVQWLYSNENSKQLLYKNVCPHINIASSNDFNAFGDISAEHWDTIIIYKNIHTFPPHLDMLFNKCFKNTLFTNMQYSNNVYVQRSYYNYAQNEEEQSICPYRYKRYDTYTAPCSYNCNYCFEKHTQQDTNAIKIFDINTIKKNDIIMIGTYRDCFPPEEETQKNTYNAIKQCNEHNIHYILRTKSTLFANDEYIKIYNKKLCHIQATISTTDDELAKKIEPGAPAPSKRIEAIEKMQKLGFDISVRISPFDPQITNPNIINKIQCDKAIIEFLAVNPMIKNNFNINYDNYTYYTSSIDCTLPIETQQKLYNTITLKQVTVCPYNENICQYWINKKINIYKSCCNIQAE